jgi:DNA adenine methylase
MKYLGSKNRIAKYILPIMLEYREEGMVWVEPFVGGANMIDKVEGKRLGSDLNEYVISLLNQMSKPNFKAPKIDEEKYNDIKEYESQYPRWITGYAGTQLSFGATWFGSYRRDNTGKRNYCLEAQRNVNNQSKNLQGVEFVNYSYDELPINTDNALIYCDPPYNTKATKGKYKDEFDHIMFWKWCREMSDRGHTVFVSEYNAPNDFVCVWEKEISQRMNNNVKTKKTVEKLFIAP